MKIECLKQNAQSTLIAYAYQDNGYFFLQIIDIEGKDVFKLDINPELGIDAKSNGMRVCRTPLIVTTDFLERNTVFVNLYHKKERSQYHLLVDFRMKTVIERGHVSFDAKLNSSEQNYPIDTFYVQSKARFYCFYRQGMLVEVDESNIAKGSTVTQIMPREIEKIYYLHLHEREDDALSQRKEFFICLYGGKLHFYDLNGQGKIQRYYTLQNQDLMLQRVNLTYVQGDYIFQMIFEKSIIFYRMKPQGHGGKFIPLLEMTIYNYMKCSQLIFSKNG